MQTKAISQRPPKAATTSRVQLSFVGLLHTVGCLDLTKWPETRSQCLRAPLRREGERIRPSRVVKVDLCGGATPVGALSYRYRPFGEFWIRHFLSAFPSAHFSDSDERLRLHSQFWRPGNLGR